ncbi:MAG: hypothetical protein ACOYOV_15175 [Bacteroidales bacterium]
MLLEVSNIQRKQAVDIAPARIISRGSSLSLFVGQPHDILSKHLGKLVNGQFYQFYSFGRFSMHDIIVYLLKQIGPAHIICGTWSISQESMESLVRLKNRNEILSLRFVLDPRVKVTKAKPLQMLTANFPFVFSSWHAKVTVMENENWKISIVSSQNMTKNPKIERGCIFTDAETFEFDKKVLENELRSGRINND